ncbi:hypothetical protein TWF481_004891 [Arthrobotrys musiformis]|uniref:Uncharacterized protein n=1 Tax=Arthrobotrys musiformis TaxID=47236 RepID=A0AAV9WRL1_9PEZI
MASAEALQILEGYSLERQAERVEWATLVHQYSSPSAGSTRPSREPELTESSGYETAGSGYEMVEPGSETEQSEYAMEQSDYDFEWSRYEIERAEYEAQMSRYEDGMSRLDEFLSQNPEAELPESVRLMHESRTPRVEWLGPRDQVESNYRMVSVGSRIELPDRVIYGHCDRPVERTFGSQWGTSAYRRPGGSIRQFGRFGEGPEQYSEAEEAPESEDTDSERPYDADYWYVLRSGALARRRMREGFYA